MDNGDANDGIAKDGMVDYGAAVDSSTDGSVLGDRAKFEVGFRAGEGDSRELKFRYEGLFEEVCRAN